MGLSALTLLYETDVDDADANIIVYRKRQQFFTPFTPLMRTYRNAIIHAT